jgi:galactoside O-acetyltransferase
MGSAYLYANEGELKIGNNCSINTNVQLGASQGKIHNGDNVLIGPNVVLRAADHGLAMQDLIFLQPHRKGAIYVHNDVWIAANAVITSGVTLGEGSVIGAGSTVTRDVPPFAIVGGNPAVIIGRRN